MMPADSRFPRLSTIEVDSPKAGARPGGPAEAMPSGILGYKLISA